MKKKKRRVKRVKKNIFYATSYLRPKRFIEASV
jgi:hypothetical protein